MIVAFSFDWGAVGAAVSACTGVGIIVRWGVRDEIRRVTNGKFGHIDTRLSSLEASVHTLEAVERIPHRINYEEPEPDKC